jgi:hypothetical protein
MYLNIREHAEARNYQCIEMETGKLINDVVWADEEKEVYGQIKRKKNGAYVLNENRTDIVIEEKKGRIKLVKITDDWSEAQRIS